ncbi:hypothetical protein O6H91_09G119000 [Diphasiastrum complanatum]|nr:hypothetical protein O6H91_09G118000 [Diphasiastrum complanatum]KAJ7545415.1 hypothetical protein O6H91_09G119000 [Diphasiastrum complanatum]
MVYYGILANFVTFLVYKFHHSYPDSANIVINFMGTSSLTPIIGAVIADSYLGRYWTIAIFSTVYFVGLVCLTISAAVPSMRPSNVGCTQLEIFLGVCEKPSLRQTAFLYFGWYVVALGSGGIRPCVAAFGADQFNEEDPAEKKNLDLFFNWFYFMINLGGLLSLTGIVYIQNYLGWGWGLGSLAFAMAVANIIFLAGTPLYRYKLPSGSPFARLAQVVVAAVRKRNLKVPEDSNLLFEVYDRESAIIGSRKLPHTRTLRFFDKAAVTTSSDMVDQSKPSASDPNPWRLCTITQVEELKVLWRLLPIWATNIMVNTVFSQVLSFSVEQGFTMDRSVGKHFTILSASVPVFAPIFVFIFLPLYAKLYVPMVRNWTGHQSGNTHLQRVGAGLVFSTLAALAAALVEGRRRHLAYATGLAQNPLATLPISVFWLLPQYAFIGLAEVFASVGQLEFFYEQAPDSMRSIGTSFFSTAAAAGSYFASLLNTILRSATKSTGQSPWVNNNINLAHVDYYCWLLVVLSTINFVIFVVVAHRFEYRQTETHKDPTTQDIPLD